MYPIALKTNSLHMSEDEFLQFCRDNPDLKLERNSNQDIIIMAPTVYETGNFNSELIYQVADWNVKNGRPGYCFDSNTGITLPNGAVRSPDVSWVSKERHLAIPEGELKKFAHVCPDFIIELRSISDSLPALKLKMEEYFENGCRLGFLIDPAEKKVHIYKPESATIKSFSDVITGENVLEGFVLDLSFIG